MKEVKKSTSHTWGRRKLGSS